MNYEAIDNAFLAIAFIGKAIAGVFVGFAILHLMDLFGYGGWFALGIGLVAIVMIVCFWRLSDFLFKPAFDKMFENEDKRPIETVKPEPRGSGLIALGLGIVVAFILTRFVPVTAIFAYL